ncbi:hypothetical protein KIN20_015852 [Parelaphostrongylus tenuis]|uniref:Uncharacterized protein n=1 Tax=Parelaphostrongylus tenuis TaxID=148309 RepID=A0AAD5MXW3_PARTN|nr:hypothetical protein KIN20_015852 [Parelaphostrongylus tenuis]
MVKLLIAPFVASLLSLVLGCGVVPTGQTGTRSFTVTGFTVPVQMAYSTKGSVPARVPGIATTQDGAKIFVTRLVMQTVFDVLESQARSTLLPDAVTRPFWVNSTLRSTTNQ